MNMTKTAGNLRVTIENNSCAESPRQAFENVAAFWAENTHRNYNFHEVDADDVLTRIQKQVTVPEDLGSTYEEILWLEKIQTDDSPYVIVPINMYDHSGLSFSTGSDSCKWDSGVIGFMLIDKERWAERHGAEWNRTAAQQAIDSEVQTLNEYHTWGAVGYRVEQQECCECCGHEKWVEVDSCGGFYGDYDSQIKCIKGEISETYPELAAKL